MTPETASDCPEGGEDDEIVLCPEEEARHSEESRLFGRLGTYAGPVILVHLLLLYAVVSAATGFTLPSWLKSDRLAAWLWMNGALAGVAFWALRVGRFPIAPRIWATGRRARHYALIWIVASLFWFLLPALLADAWMSLRTHLSGW